MRIIVSTNALISIAEIEAFYFEIRPSLAKDFKKELSLAFKSLKIFYKYPIRYDNVGVYKVRRFPYLIHFTAIEEKGVLEIDQVLHERRQSRL